MKGKKYLIKLLSLAMVSLMLAACSGDGDDEDSDLVYTGKTTPVVITSENVKEIVSSTLGGVSTNGFEEIVLNLQSQSAKPAGVYSNVQASVQFAQVVKAAVNEGKSQLTGATNSETVFGSCGGSFEASGSETSATIKFSNFCDEQDFDTDGLTFNGTLSIAETQSGGVVSFKNFAAKGIIENESVDLIMSGEMNVSGVLDNFSVSMSFVAQDNLTNVQVKLDNFTLTVNGRLVSFDGRVYVSAAGYVDIITDTPLDINLTNGIPDAGVVRFVGGENTEAEISISTGGSYVISINEVEVSSGSWSDLEIDVAM